MKTLIIIGNGFDLDHSVPTSYMDFKNYVSSTYYNANRYPIVGSTTGADGEIVVDQYQSTNLLLYLMDQISESEMWSHFEEDLAYLDITDLAPSATDYVSDDDDDSGIKYLYVLEDYKNDLYYNVALWQSLFMDWIESVELEIEEIGYKLKPAFQELLKKEDLRILSFNYTMFIEKYYHYAEVLHIHNSLIDKNLVFGHGKDKENVDYDYSISAMNSMMRNMYMKNVQGQYFKNEQFFNDISFETKEIYSYGFSFSDVDCFYIKKICEKLSDDTKWYLKKHKNVEIEQTKILKNCGFTGKILYF